MSESALDRQKHFQNVLAKRLAAKPENLRHLVFVGVSEAEGGEFVTESLLVASVNSIEGACFELLTRLLERLNRDACCCDVCKGKRERALKARDALQIEVIDDAIGATRGNA